MGFTIRRLVCAVRSLGISPAATRNFLRFAPKTLKFKNIKQKNTDDGFAVIGIF
jgi:hypothetical protein